MRLTVAFLRMIRLNNLFFIVVAQCLFQFCVYEIVYKGHQVSDSYFNFILLVIASVLIAAAGYIINDYFDINIDEVNKPHKLVVDKFISRRWAIAWHFIMSATGVLLTFWALPFFEKWYLIIANILCVALLWLYSTTFKRQLLIGNVVVSLLTAWSIPLIFLSKLTVADAFAASSDAQTKFFRLTVLYAGFAFIISLIREAIKDIEDMEGDAKYGCRTMPILWGVNATKVYVSVWLIVLITMLLILQLYVLQFQWWLMIGYCLLAVIAPLCYVFWSLFKAQKPIDYHKLSNQIKMIMLTGILSMAFFYYYL